MSLWNRVTVISPPASPVDGVISLASLKSHLSIDADEYDADLTRFLKSAVAEIDGPSGIGYALLSQTWQLSVDGFPSVVELPGAPIVSVASVKYIDHAGAEQTIPAEDYSLDSSGSPARLVPAYGKAWPSPRCIPGAVKIAYVVGAANAAAINPRLIDYICLSVSQKFEFRSAVAKGDMKPLPFGASAILSEFRQLSVCG